MKKDILNWRASTIHSLLDWIHFLAFGLVFSVGIIGILSSSDQDLGGGTGAIWEYDLGVSRGLSSPAIGDDGTIYIGTGLGIFDSENDVRLENDNLYAINPDGSLKWRYATGGTVYSSPAIGSTGTIYAGSADGYLYAIDPNGSLKWRYDTGDSIWSSPALGGGESIYVGSDNGNLYAIIPADGSLKPNWPYVTGGSIRSSPAIGCDGTIYVGSGDGNLYAINPDGTLKPNWPYPANSSIRSSPAIGSDGTIYVGSFEGDLYAINPDGSIKPNWPFDTSTVDWDSHQLPPILSSPAVGSDGTIYVGSVDGQTYAINPDGSLKSNWPYSTRELFSNEIVASSPAIGNDGTIYVGDNDLYALNPDGTAKQIYDIPDIESSPVIGSNGILYVVSGGDLLAFDVASNRLADTPWPMFRHDAKHTGREVSVVDIPANVNATAGDSQVVISWDPGSGGSSYNIYWSTSPGVTKSDTRISLATNPYSHTGLTNGVTYYYAVTAENTCGESGLSNEVSATPVSGGAYAVIISPGDGTTVNMCPATTIFTANVTGGDTPYSYSWVANHTAGAGFNIIGPVDEQTFEVCAWDSMTEGTIEVTVTDFNSIITTDIINVDAL